MTVNLFADFDAMDDPYRIEGISGEIRRAEAKLGNPGFTGKAPQAVVDAERGKLEVAKEKLRKLQERYETLQSA